MDDLAGNTTPIPKGMLKVKGFSEFVTPEFLANSIRQSAEGGQTMLLPGQYETVPGNEKVSVARMNLSKVLHTEGRVSGLFGEEDKQAALKEKEEREEAAYNASLSEAYQEGIAKALKAVSSGVGLAAKSFRTLHKALDPKKMTDIEAGQFTKAYLEYKAELERDKPENLEGWKTVYKYGVGLLGLKKPAHIHKDTGEKHVMMFHQVSDEVFVVYCRHLETVYYFAPKESEEGIGG